MNGQDPRVHVHGKQLLQSSAHREVEITARIAKASVWHLEAVQMSGSEMESRLISNRKSTRLQYNQRSNIDALICM